MPLKINLRHLEARTQRLTGELPVQELDLDIRDETIQTKRPLIYNLEAEQVEDGILLQGSLRLILDCECVRCLKPFQHTLKLDAWACLLPLTGDEPVPVVNDCVDLTPYLREDILLELPQHPLCNSECRGLPKKPVGKKKKSGAINQSEGNLRAWSELNKLKF